jgi:hypothetical protein
LLHNTSGGVLLDKIESDQLKYGVDLVQIVHKKKKEYHAIEIAINNWGCTKKLKPMIEFGFELIWFDN